MKLSLIIALVALVLMAQAQSGVQDASDLVVVCPSLPLGATARPADERTDYNQ